jgi:glycosyltransferase involved in cell wall biosynthesis
MSKVLYIAHGHAEEIPGGAERFAYELFHGMRASGEFEAWLLCRTHDRYHNPHPGTPFLSNNSDPRELLLFSQDFDYFLLSQPNKLLITDHFRDFLLEIRPDVVHFHHVVYLGLECIRQVRTALPHAAIVYTLHEYVPICNAGGYMVHTDNSLCYGASPGHCHQCYPSIAEAEFKMRELFIRAHFHLIDAFIAPSRFLLRRYIEWGIPEAKITYLESGRQVQSPAPPRPLAGEEVRGEFGFFGQLNPNKGILTLLEAMEILERKGESKIHLTVYGANLEYQSESFQSSFREQLQRVRRNVSFLGRYENRDIPKLMRALDWVVVPSVWWENSPLVIQEAFMHRRPVLCSDIGGMAEKVRHQVDGLHFITRNAYHLAATMQLAATTPGLWEELSSRIEAVYSVEEAVAAHAALYRNLLDGKTAKTTAVGTC